MRNTLIEEQIDRANDEDYQKHQKEIFASEWTEYANMEWKSGDCKLIQGTNWKDCEF